MANLIPISWDTRAIETNPLAIDVTERLFPEYIKDVVQLGGYVSKPMYLTKFNGGKHPQICLHTYAWRRIEDI